MKWIKLPESFHRMSKRAIAAALISVIVPTSTVVTLAATGTLNHSSVSASSGTNSSSYSSSFATSNVNRYVSSTAVSSDSASSSTISSSSLVSSTPKGGDNVANDIDTINKATTDGLNKINSATSQAIEKIQNTAPTSTPSKLSPEEARKQAARAWASLSPEEKKQRTYYELPDPYDTWKGLDPQTTAYDAAVKTYNDYAASVGVTQDALHTEPYKSQAITRWFKDHPQYCSSQPTK
jgi:hypothetical protein